MKKPLILITGAAGDIGSTLARTLESDYTVIGLDRAGQKSSGELIEVDFTEDASVARALETLRQRHGERIAAVVHLAAYFDFTGDDNPLYQAVTVDGTRRLLKSLQSFTVDRFIYSSTMLVHAAVKPGERIDESAPIAPAWAYPKSKADAEQVIHECHGRIPYTVLRLAGLYDEHTCVPTLANQIARIYERDLQSHVYPGKPQSGQAFIHRDDMMRAIRSVIERRDALPATTAILAGEPDPMSFEELQDTLGRLIHAEEQWTTARVPAPIAKAGAWVQEKAEPLVPDSIDKGEPPFVRPFMVDIAEDHYALDISRARELLDWQPQHDLRRTLPAIVAALKKDPVGWYQANHVTPPSWLESAKDAGEDPEAIRKRYERRYREAHRSNLWAPCINMALATWLITAPPLLGYESRAMALSDVISGIALLVFSAVSLHWRASWARWTCAVIGTWLLAAPLLFWAPTVAEYFNGTLIGMLVIGFAVLVKPSPGVSPIAAESGPTIPPGWDYSPSSWLQRLPVVLLAFIGLHISRYLTAYQLGHIDGVWDPFFLGSLEDPKNGTEEIITSSVSQAWPVPDAGLGALTYALEILTGIIGSSRRWRTMPWLVMLFGLMIVPLGLVSLIFIIIQPIVIGTWCTLCLIAAAAMLLQIPYSLDELVATAQFLKRRKRAGQSLLRVFFVGDTDEMPRGRPEKQTDELAQPLPAIVQDAVSGGVGLPANLVACIAIGVWLMFTRLTVGAEGAMANADHLIGALIITTSVVALAEVARVVRFVNIAFGVALLITPFLLDAGNAGMISSVVCGVALIALSIRRGAVHSHYGRWTEAIV
ncbi:vitamin K epoxide reductase family protein [Steroidobacter cummioxidans]|uniref:vitamin K epoxide reductase family protein n=1 Tax=Steroidobacter cummioxidans TaxID=1803913 RepID=UPI000E3128E8|nr:vitamin K epoxide reductase family protein [Steroidobacter cummioxidans]